MPDVTVAIMEALSNKIDNEIDWQDLRAKFLLSAPTYNNLDGVTENMPWWAQREHYRIKYTAYRSTDVTTKINKIAPWAFVHVSKENPDHVAYTPDGEYGKRDRQTSMALGRLMVRLFPLFRDEYIQQQVADHKAEMGLVIKFVSTEEEICEVYATGPESCMRHGIETWPRTNGRMPVAAYGYVPGLELAYIADDNNHITARALVRPADKIVIRTYGDSKLYKALARQGYKYGSLEGLKMKAQFLTGGPETHKRVLMPYLDANGERGSSAYCSLALIDDTIHILTQEQRDVARARGITLNHGVVTEGYLDMMPLNLSDIFNIDVLTGENIVDVHSANRVYVPATETTKEVQSGLTNYTESQLREMGYVEGHANMHSNLVWIKQELTFTVERGPHWGNTTYVENLRMRNALGFTRLSPKYYPGSDWIKDSADEYVSTHDGHAIKREDAMYIIYNETASVMDNATGVEGTVKTLRSKVVHKSDGFTAGAVKVHSRFRNIPEWAEEDVPIIKTVNNRKVVDGHHEVVELWNGGWEFKNKTKTKRIAGKSYYWLSGPVPAALTDGGAVYVQAIRDKLDYMYDQAGTRGWGGSKWLIAAMHTMQMYGNWNPYIRVRSGYSHSNEYVGYDEGPWLHLGSGMQGVNIYPRIELLIWGKIKETANNPGVLNIVKDWVEEHRWDEAEANARDHNRQDDIPGIREINAQYAGSHTFLGAMAGAVEMRTLQQFHEQAHAVQAMMAQYVVNTVDALQAFNAVTEVVNNATATPPVSVVGGLPVVGVDMAYTADEQRNILLYGNIYGREALVEIDNQGNAVRIIPPVEEAETVPENQGNL